MNFKKAPDQEGAQKPKPGSRTLFALRVLQKHAHASERAAGGSNISKFIEIPRSAGVV
jgi:hypothetical protein